MKKTLYASIILIACDPGQGSDFRVACPDATSGSPEDPPPPPPPPPSIGIPVPTATCPEIIDGSITICPSAMLECRDVVVINASSATGSGPLALHWHGTFETPEALLEWDSAALAIRSMVESEGGLMVLPRADPEAVARPSNPFPWWVVCGATPSQCSRPDDFIVADEVVACAVEQGLVDPTRITTSGMSAGGIMTSHLVDRVGYLAGAVSWSGGLPEAFQPTTPAGDAAVMVIHGGVTDQYCGAGQPTGTCYSFMDPSHDLALDVSTSGDFAFLCDHQAGHSTAMAGEGAAFLAASSTGGHPWAGYPFGHPGDGPNWMLNHYCYAPGTPSPWAQ